jgi:hypothetical protein
MLAGRIAHQPTGLKKEKEKKEEEKEERLSHCH